MTSAELVGAEYWATFWEWIADKAFVLVVIFLAVEYITGRWAKPHKEALDDARKFEIAQLTKDAARLSKEGDEARAAIAKSEAETAKARAEAATATERAARIEQAAAWRVLSPQTKAALQDNLQRTAGGSVELAYSSNDPEALFLTAQIEGIFDAVNAGRSEPLWRVNPQPRMYSRAIHWDIRIFGDNAGVVVALQGAFFRAGIPFLQEPVPNIIADGPGFAIGPNAPTDATIFVGSKRPPN